MSANLQAVVDRWASAAEMSVYLHDDADAAARDALLSETECAARRRGRRVRLEGSRRSQRFKRGFSGARRRHGIVARIRSPRRSKCAWRLTHGRRRRRMRWRRELAARPGVADVRYDRRWLVAHCDGGHRGPARRPGHRRCPDARRGLHGRRRSSACRSTRAATSSTSCSWSARPGFIRGPFVAEGTLLGGIGAAAGAGRAADRSSPVARPHR